MPKNPGKPPAKIEAYSISQLAKRWGWRKAEVADLLSQRAVPAYLYGKKLQALSRSERLQTFHGYVRLTTESLHELLANDILETCPVIDDGGPFGIAPFTIIEPEGWKKEDIRIMRADVEALERAGGPTAETAPDDRKPKKAGRSTRDREAYRSAAVAVLKRDPRAANMRPSELIEHPDMAPMWEGFAGRYQRDTLHRWIKELCRNRRPGAPRKSPR